MDIDKPLTERAADLLRRPDLVRLLGAAAPLLGKIAVRYRPAPPPKPVPPPRAPSVEASPDKTPAGEVTAPPPGPPPMPSPWLKAAVA